MRLDVYGRFLLQIERDGTGAWLVLEVGAEGKRRRRDDLPLPPHLEEEEIPAYLDALLHELGGPGRSIRRVEG